MINLQPFVSREIPLAELPQWSPWPQRLLGLIEWRDQKRDTTKVDREYDKDEYLRCLNFKKENPGATADDVRAYEFRLPRKPLCVSQKNKLYELPSEQIMPVDNAVLLDALKPHMGGIDTVVELGCGYGYNLWELRRHFPEKTFLGGDYSPNAVKLAEMLYKDCPNMSIETFNFYDRSFPMLERCPKGSKVLVFSRHATEQLPTAKNVLATLTQYFDRIKVAIHLEVGFDNYGDSLLDLLRKRYVMINDYNRDLVSLIRSRSDIAFLTNEPDVYGVNSLNPSSELVWKPK
ncbi:MAG: Uncharacterized protein PeribacterA2_0954 [Candidatus Peribacter riflensis]|uniref:Methyltransferase type 11 domain-containing protein n=1 Tax=Candidatus Peribacter riflensis TaxID=1735162 RepID=A0A0S1SCP0_9BACT|nr:MAG: Uncharacterized protein PeribacterA2_0954 [Candidatus Peribacter riflensis]ALM11417.1 MAG: Uncharacterized protein PeribacterB2_0956 [Candidatus Peribacter riflensis]ALM12519.1 MAG: Uncharacterized protein PeribacterC2_0955 [Candidatus Peribacter riflensis]ALM13620.1 MAG: Uncharacterized protein PeribacterD1_0954 [Candidatus Peribacter riflensis]ALM14723.1 MAG: Uncharacterized protein PeribacterD2_0956 [Candidatus Peribacter riflensis]